MEALTQDSRGVICLVYGFIKSSVLVFLRASVFLYKDHHTRNFSYETNFSKINVVGVRLD